MTKIQKEVKGTIHIWLGPKLCGYVANPADIEVPKRIFILVFNVWHCLRSKLWIP